MEVFYTYQKGGSMMATVRVENLFSKSWSIYGPQKCPRLLLHIDSGVHDGNSWFFGAFQQSLEHFRLAKAPLPKAFPAKVRDGVTTCARDAIKSRPLIGPSLQR